MSPPRPSVSPLSNAQASAKPSPLNHRNSALGRLDTSSIGGRHVRPTSEEDRSSSLSEPEEEEDGEDVSGVGEDEEDDADEDNDEEEDEDDDDEDDDEDDDLSRARQLRGHSEDIDTEAETERLDQTPRKLRDAVDGQGRTPSKLSLIEHAVGDLSEPPSPIPDDTGAASSTSTLTGKKRKRSDTLESPLTSAESTEGESKRKRADEVKEEESNEDNDGEEQAAKLATTHRVGRGKKGKKNKQKRGTSTVLDAVESVEPADGAEENQREDVTDPQPEEDPVRKSEAMDAFAQLGKQFMAFRDTLIKERVSSIDAELALLEQPDCQHPEYLRMVASVEQRRQKQDRETRAYHHFKQLSLRQRTLGDRAQLHSQYFQTVRDVRELALDELGMEWYAIHRERRQGVNYQPDEVASRHQYIDDRNAQLRQQAKYNHEVSILSGFAKYVGFPAAPDIGPITGDALDDDLRAMKLIRRAQTSSNYPASQHHPHHHHHHHAHTHATQAPRQIAASAASSERLAHEQFIEQHAWARAPQYPNHLASTPNISHTSEWAEHTTGFRKPSSNVHRNTNPDAAGRAGLFDTPDVGRAPRDNAEHIRELDRSISAVHPNHRQALPGSSPLQVPKHRLSAGAEKDGWRNYSGTSTIDAPLGENPREEDGPPSLTAGSGEQLASVRSLAEQHDHFPRLADSNIGKHSLNPAPAHEASGNYIDDRPNMFRSTGFRPLDNTFVAAPGSVPSTS